ncbi:hypothetical protein WJX74_006666 [Apatococcus lobatus]|uniref:Uncharacterized protein n=1 Tax=Apatococcus lobatus TaxID=904363 RepID=A0AAW1PZ16_9CHLO
MGGLAVSNSSSSSSVDSCALSFAGLDCCLSKSVPSCEATSSACNDVSQASHGIWKGNGLIDWQQQPTHIIHNRHIGQHCGLYNREGSSHTFGQLSRNNLGSAVGSLKQHPPT